MNPPPRSGRGGARSGAGRKSTLTELARLWIGSECERVFREIAAKQAKIQHDDDLARTALPEFWAWINAKPVAEREAFLQSDDFREHQESIADERPLLKLTPVKRPYGLRARVIKQVATAASERYGVLVKNSLVNDCWEEWRTLQSRL
ncbi:hypothetical protein [Novosphingobium olei]|uniref:Uncharacterized protein n=1 Tax=Novosphingobium olei TaxID=2728851 RepID=A0A7Y0GC17_9SPHN|nr:hypothetical protein [Novosphingobium olei]NML95152.1 hypothetical protein [Novosphingobium olei]